MQQKLKQSLMASLKPARGEARAVLLAVAIIACASMVPVAAQDLKPGLWEINSQVQAGNPEVAQAMASAQKLLSMFGGAQRAAPDQGAGKQVNGRTERVDDGGMVVKACFTPEFIRDSLFGAPAKGNCTHQQGPRTGKTMSFHYSCTQPNASGEGKVTFHSDRAYHATILRASGGDGKQNAMRINSDARWIAADCGSVKPLHF